MDKLTPQEIANVLYRINFLPGLLAAVIIGYALFNPNTVFGTWGWQSTGITTLFVTGTLCEGVYFILYKKEEYTHKKYLWIYSIVVNSLFIVGYLATLFASKFSPVIFMVVYPLYFLIMSCIALKKINALSTTTAGR